ncbi:acyl carrier protein phosphodiesterase [Arsenicibacter rosenii]|uniref:ACP phosphodiesterase n=1 Tax=Arsenicibacter rosenii TaxID=1750698 RepID=A0A1S2VRC1_9BACT|nr:ACP phosphodiesterase [Arsenicibacter rosenii]OIN60940.1 hypothetical protein BLX24_02320 [Arsenicibacter rosenii]
MNILAHAYLSNREEGLLIGNFIADFIKGDPANPRHGLSAGVVHGIRLHRSIDAFTDTHPAVERVRRLLRPRCHKYAGVAVDVFFDHFLAKHFEALTGESLTAYVAWFYQTLLRVDDRLPAGASRMATYMIRQNWLSNYQHLSGIERSLKGLAGRTTFASGLDTAVEDLVRFYEPISAEFHLFWPDLTGHVQRSAAFSG